MAPPAIVLGHSGAFRYAPAYRELLFDPLCRCNEKLRAPLFRVVTSVSAPEIVLLLWYLPRAFRLERWMSRDFDLVVAGSGIAGLTAALTGARLGLRTLCLTGDVLGGQLLSINKIDGYPGFPDGTAGYDLCPIAQEQAVAAGAEVAATTLDRLTSQDGRWRLVTGDGELIAHGIVLATGAALKELGVPGEDRLKGKGVSHCASCDAPLLRGKPVVVVGGGDSACQEALTLAEAASKVTILHRGTELSAQRAYRDAVMQQANVEIRFNHVAEEILGENGVTAVRARDQASTAASEIEAAGVFVYIGLAPATRYLNGAIKLWADERIPTDTNLRTALTGVAAAGAVRQGWAGRAAASAGDGAAAAIAIADYLRHDRWRDG
jgi:thioredoxin reductase (NADPH)